MRRLQTHQQMHVVPHSADALRECAEAPNRAAKIIVEARPPGWQDDRLSVFGSENEVVMQAEIGG